MARWTVETLPRNIDSFRKDPNDFIVKDYGVLDVLHRRAKKAGVADRIQTHKCEHDRLGVEIQVDFALAFMMIHEVPDQTARGRASTMLPPSPCRHHLQQLVGLVLNTLQHPASSSDLAVPGPLA